MAEHPPCPAFAWIGQPLTHCDQCSHPAWSHDYIEVADRSPNRGPFAPLVNEPWSPAAPLVNEPWSPALVKLWQRDGRINGDRAKHLLNRPSFPPPFVASEVSGG